MNVLYRRVPGQNSQDTHDCVDVLPEPQVQEATIPVIADGAVDAWQSARRTVFQARITQQPDGEHPSATCGVDYTNSPFGPPGQSCTASFLMCTACPNARVTPAHRARLAHLHQALGSLGRQPECAPQTHQLVRLPAPHPRRAGWPFHPWSQR
ncbi:hypothetical protein [Streptomyces sp. NPDC006415]|uniref:hypothetical protein n=1 Tax=Streptomyces sp. NPDC006415 TaxID=3155351 RepID=UPI0033A1FFC3